MWVKCTPSWDEKHVFDGDLDVGVEAAKYGTDSVMMYRSRVFGEYGVTSYASFEEAKLNALRRAVNLLGPKIDALREELKRAENKRVCGSCRQEIKG